MNNKNMFVRLCLILFAAIFGGCGKATLNLPDQPVDSYNQVYMPAAVNNPVVKTLEITDSLQTATYGVVYGGLGYPDTDISVSFMVDSAKLDSFNLANNTHYLLLPTGSYTMSGMEAVIPKGKLSSDPMTIGFKTTGPDAMPALKEYLLPISIASSAKVNEDLRTTFFVVKAQPDLNDYPFYDRSAWQIVDFSSEEANGEGPDNGHLIHAFDGDNNTFWHTQWQGASPGPPHYFTIDMGTVQTLHGLAFLGRQSSNNGKPNEVNVQVSLDNVTWTDAGTFNLENNNALHSVFLPEGFKECRYFKVIINSSYNASFTHLAELNAF